MSDAETVQLVAPADLYVVALETRVERGDVVTVDAEDAEALQLQGWTVATGPPPDPPDALPSLGPTE